MISKPKSSDILNKAADLIETQGWCRGDFIDYKTGALCHLGAIREAAGYHLIKQDDEGYWCRTYPDDVDQLVLAGDATRAAEKWDTKIVGPDIPGWNDYTCRSAEEAVSALRDAAALAHTASD